MEGAGAAWPWRIIFGLAAAYNLAFGAWAILDPLAFFRWFELAPPAHPWVWACLGMVIGVYGLGYAYVAWRPARGDAIAALGLIGKVLGPIGWLWNVWQGEVPVRTYPLILADDLIWWFPFLLYLFRANRHRRMLVTWLIVAVHLAAWTLLALSRQGTEVNADAAARAGFIAAHTPQWVTCWFLWSVASLGLLTFFVMWAARLCELGARRVLPVLGCALCAAGLVCDLASEVGAVTQVTAPGLSIQDFSDRSRAAMILGVGAANLLYCLGGCALSAASWNAGLQRRWLRTLVLVTWLSGFVLCAGAFAGAPLVMTIAGVILLSSFLVWASLTAPALRSAGPPHRDPQPT